MTSSPINPVIALVLAAAVGAVGIRLIADSRRSRKTGVAHIFFQWPNDIDRQDQPLSFWISVSLASFVGYFLILAAFLCVIGTILRGLNAG
jgi:hypothetical protein